MSTHDTITVADGLRALANLQDDGLPTPRMVHLYRGRVEPTIYIHDVDDLTILAGMVAGYVELEWNDDHADEGWDLSAHVGPLHLTGTVFAHRITPDQIASVPGAVIVDQPAPTWPVAADAEAVVA